MMESDEATESDDGYVYAEVEVCSSVGSSSSSSSDDDAKDGDQGKEDAGKDVFGASVASVTRNDKRKKKRSGVVVEEEGRKGEAESS